MPELHAAPAISRFCGIFIMQALNVLRFMASKHFQLVSRLLIITSKIVLSDKNPGRLR